ncbi:MAG: polyphosphate kinase 1 [Leptolyngbyaceae cyanobacterium SL_7_1]|nr:polyphosphate kinase 1 [Leptolyngbyaceae cyanobacterium SL_7_1]
MQDVQRTDADFTAETTDGIDLNDAQYYFNRELSWLQFNDRVLSEALDTRNPLLERLKFVGIFSSNLDEFFMVRVSTLKEQATAQSTKLMPDGLTPQQQLDAISQQLHPKIVEQHALFEKELRPALANHGVHILNYMDLSQEQRFYLQHFFEERVFPVLTPLAVDPGHPFPRISNLSLNLAVVVKDVSNGQEHFARVKVPDLLPRFVELPKDLQQQHDPSNLWSAVPLEQVIAHNLETLFPGMNIQEYSVFRVTRDADFPVQEDEADDLLLAIQEEINKRRFRGEVVRLELQASASELVRQTLTQEMKLTDADIYEIDGLLHLKDLMSLLGLPLPQLKDEPWVPQVPARLKAIEAAAREARPLDETNNIFAEIREGDVLVHHPYESFASSVELFITQAAIDPKVLAIKMTLYRTSGDSPIVRALITAAEHRKQVVALVELKARFDEESNINWAQLLEESGVHVVYGLIGLKTHTKVVLVVRQEDDGIRRYVHIGTGNYNSKTAKLYTDLGILSCHSDLGADLTDLFNYLTGYSRQHSYRKLLVAPVSLRDRMAAMIRREIDHCRSGNPGRIVAKMNSLVDPQMIKLLYEASQAGVEIDLLVRGICCLRPGVPGVSDTIRVMSIVGRYLEHSRIYHFYNQGDEEIYIGSADWMTRNLDRRVEAVTPIEDPAIAAQLKEILQLLLSDNRQAWDLHADGEYRRRYPATGEAVRSAQEILMGRG